MKINKEFKAAIIELCKEGNTELLSIIVNNYDILILTSHLRTVDLSGIADDMEHYSKLRSEYISLEENIIFLTRYQNYLITIRDGRLINSAVAALIHSEIDSIEKEIKSINDTLNK